MLNDKWLIIVLLLIPLKAHAQISSAIDTINFLGNSSQIKLENQFIIDSSLEIIGNKSKVVPIEIKPIEGEIFFEDSLISQQIIIKYDYLDNALPFSVGPKWKMLPQLDLEKRIINSKQHIKEENKKSNSNVFSSGSFYRQIKISPLGGSDFTGGLQMQINGKISDRLNVSGILTDQDFPIQPEGTTRELDELDNVHFIISHENFKLNAGDVFYENHGINRKLVGLTNSFQISDISGTTVYAKSKGNYKYLELKGRDGDQGPYKLLGNDGNTDIVILNGTEKVWVNGKELIRGTNYDYIIDYSLGEVTFTPRVIIDFDSDLSFEYQYSDDQFQKGFMGGNVKKKIGRKGIIDIGVFKEEDRYRREDFNDDYLDSLSSIPKGLISVSTAINDENGDYILENGIYHYDPSYLASDSIRFQVVFNSDSDGDYERRISEKGRVYYSFLPDEGRNEFIQLYSPFRTVKAPKIHNHGYFDYDYRVNEHININGEFASSMIDDNRIYSSDLTLGGSYKYGFSIDSLYLGKGKFNLNFNNWDRGPRYRSLNREHKIMHARLWNLDSSITQGVNETSIKSRYVIEDFSNSYFELARLKYLDNENIRIHFQQNISNQRFNNSFFNYIAINDDTKKFNRIEGNLQTNISSYSPFVRFLSETDKSKGSFYKLGLGLSMDKENKKFKMGFDNRIDDNTIDNGDIYQTSDFVGYVQYNNRGREGVNQNIIYKKRLKNGGDIISDQDYTLLDMDISKYDKTSPYRWIIKLRQEQTLVQNKTIVYDSVGLGLGQYRYDPIFNTYISDINGSFISYSILSGGRTPNTIFKGSQEFAIDLDKFDNFSNMLIRLNSKQEFQGREPRLDHLFETDIHDSSITRLNFFNRLELNYANIRRAMVWLQNSKHYNGFDSRGNDLQNNKQVGIDFNFPLGDLVSIRNKGKIKSDLIESTVSTLRNRNTSGWWNDLRLQMRLHESTDLDLGLLLGAEEGFQKDSGFMANAIGLTFTGKILFKNIGRLRTSLDYVQIKEEKNIGFLPPESFEGYPIGVSFRTNSTFTYSINKSISVLLSLNTIDDERYENFISFQGEVRAYF